MGCRCCTQFAQNADDGVGEACERMGMMLMCETRLMKLHPEGLEQLETMIKRYRIRRPSSSGPWGTKSSACRCTPVGDHISHRDGAACP